MSLLPAVVPAIPENRAEVAPARLARKVAPLFGVPWPDGPFGARSWVCDYTKITLSEIARGAPLPTREQAARITAPEGAWSVVERIGMTGRRAGLPNEIANATLNRFGPDTRAAVVLSAVNRLLVPVREAIDTALALLTDDRGQRLPPRLRLVAWAGLVIEVFRSQPALVAAGVNARFIQRQLMTTWQLPLAPGLDVPLTRCEVTPDAAPLSAASAPQLLDVADATFAALRLHGDAAEPDPSDGDPGPAALTGQLRRDEWVDLLLRRLLAAGTAAEDSYLWMSERRPGQLVVEALMPAQSIVDRFVADTWCPPATEADQPLVLPAVPSGDLLRAQPVPTRRAVLIALLAVLRHLQSSPSGRDATRRVIPPVLAALADTARRAFGPDERDDPVAAIVACRTADMAVETLRPDGLEDLTGPVHDLLAGMDRCEDLLRRGLLDRGAAAEVISSACVELAAVAAQNNGGRGQGLPDPAELRERVRRSWATYHDALEIPPFSATDDVPTPPPLVSYHLQNYAAFLARSTEDPDLEEAVALFRGLVIPAREQFFRASGHHLPLRHSLQVATRATGRLATNARDRGDHQTATRWAATGRDWIRQALGAEETRQLLGAPPTERASRFALLAAPALLLAVELDVPEPADDLQQVASLLELVRRWEVATVGDGQHHARHDEVVALSTRLATLRQEL